MHNKTHKETDDDARDKQPRLLVINGSLKGEAGNCHRLTRFIRDACESRGAAITELVLAAHTGSMAALEEMLLAAEGFIVTTGCYWSHPGSVLQRFLEVSTAWEVMPHFLGKPAAVISTMHSVGGLEVARSVACTLQLMGCVLPPLGVMSLSRVGQMALAQGEEADVWRPSDIGVLVHNVLRVCRGFQGPWAAWPVTRSQPAAGAYPGVGGFVGDDEAPWLR